MKVVLATFVVLGMLLPAAAFANDKTPDRIGVPIPAVNCATAGLTSHTDPMLYAIPDCWAGFRCGPLQVHDGGTVGFVIVSADNEVARWHEQRLLGRYPRASVIQGTREAARALAAQLFKSV